MKPGGLERVRIGRETRQSIRDKRAGKLGHRHVCEIGRDYESLSWRLFSGHGAAEYSLVVRARNARGIPSWIWPTSSFATVVITEKVQDLSIETLT
jgi:hypothetical protein